MTEGGLDPKDLIKITHDKLSTEAVSDCVTCPSCGAISMFIGDHTDLNYYLMQQVLYGQMHAL